MIINASRVFVGLGLSSVSWLVAAHGQSESKGFVEESTSSLLLRNSYYNRDYKDGINDVKVWGQGFIGRYGSGFTQGIIGLGMDAHVLSAMKLDSGRGRNYAEFFSVADDSHPRDEQSQVGGAAKLRISNTTVTHGSQFPTLPVLTYRDNRLLPQTFTGTLLTSREIPGLELNVGRFTGDSRIGYTAHDAGRLESNTLYGGSYRLNKNLNLALYHSDVVDQYKKTYAGISLSNSFGAEHSLVLDLNIYKTDYYKNSTSSLAMGGDGDHNQNTIWSFAAIYTVGSSQLQLSHQRNTGDAGYAYDFGDGGALWLANSLYSDFNLNDERSWVASYEHSFSALGLPGLSYKVAYGYGSNIVAGDIRDGHEREIFNQVKYTVQAGQFRDLSLRIRNSFYRATNEVGPDMNELRVYIEYPLSLL